jgi:hypothetical protein
MQQVQVQHSTITGSSYVLTEGSSIKLNHKPYFSGKKQPKTKPMEKQHAAHKVPSNIHHKGPKVRYQQTIEIELVPVKRYLPVSERKQRKRDLQEVRNKNRLTKQVAQRTGLTPQEYIEEPTSFIGTLVIINRIKEQRTK